RYTLDAVRYMFDQGCPLVILGCNTASAKALRTIQQQDLPEMDDSRLRVLGVIRPTVECLGQLSQNSHIGILATQGTVSSHSYEIETAKLFPDFTVSTHACPMWVPLVEYGEADSDGADFFVRREIETIFNHDPEIDTLVLACTHYPLLIDKIRKYTPAHVRIVTQGEIVARSLKDYLDRHSGMRDSISTGGTVKFLTTESAERFSPMAAMFMGHDVSARRAEY
ncbi:MAG: aspartate/glutamate racemase family protein, partial [Muribaculaceae bacterium]|nr:aspartate/glutamate racemase family protein [Muribaculaceae bacterium]